MFWVMRQPTSDMGTCVFVEARATVQIARRSRTPRLSALPADRGQDHSAFLLSRSSPVPPRMSRRNDRCRAVSRGRYPAGAPVILFKAINEKSNDATQSKTQARPEPPATCTLPLPGTCMPVRRSLTLSAVSVSRSRLAGPARREQLERRDPPPAAGAAAGGVRCHRTTPPPGPPAPRVPRSDRRARGWSRRTLMCGGPRSDLRPPVHVPRL